MSEHTEWLLNESWMNLQVALSNAPEGEKEAVAKALACVDHAIRVTQSE